MGTRGSGSSRGAKLLLGALLAVGLAAAGCGGGVARVPLVLDFTPNAAHAPIYAAAREGFDRRHGIRLEIRVPASAPDSLKLLSVGRAELGVLDIHDLGLARQRGADLVGVAALVQRPLAALIARPGIARPRQLDGGRIGVSGVPSDPAVVRAVVEGDGGRFSTLRLITIGFAAVPSLIERKVDAVPAFWNAEGVTLRQRGVPVSQFRVDDYGAPRYPELVLVTSRATLRRRRGEIIAALRAIRDGGMSVLSDPEPAVRQIAAAGGGDQPLVRAELRAISPAFRPLLRLDRTVLARWARWDARFGILKTPPQVDRTFAFGLAG